MLVIKRIWWRSEWKKITSKSRTQDNGQSTNEDRREKEKQEWTRFIEVRNKKCVSVVRRSDWTQWTMVMLSTKHFITLMPWEFWMDVMKSERECQQFSWFADSNRYAQVFVSYSHWWRCHPERFRKRNSIKCHCSK